MACVFGSGNLQVYIDGQPNGAPVSISAIVDASTIASAFIGKRVYDSAQPFNGQMDEIMVFKKALSADEVKQLVKGASENLRYRRIQRHIHL